ncbi:hypothetical protein ACFX5E_07400 [Flavobacterium sp. LS2P90]|uniref:DUF4168 domain-containing protein n=1 Tax=Flavobacterium xylosi TaxID=3230415 RepID=A0ABW6HWX3_9FLAO
MKIVQSLAISAFVLLSIQTVSAQYGNNGYGGNGYGGRGRMNSGMSQDRGQDKPREIPAEETISKIMLKLKPAVGLDELQEIAISNILLESIKRQGVILKQETNQSDQMKDLQILSENTERRVIELLNDDQKEKYKIFSEESKNPKKSKKNR